MSVLMSLATAWPSHTISMAETKEFLPTYLRGGAAERARRRVDAIGIETRRSIGSMRDMVRVGGIEARNGRYVGEAVDLATRAARAALSGAGVTTHEITRVIATSSTGHMVPSLADHVAVRLSLAPTVARMPLIGLGCAGSMRALAAASCGHGGGDRTLVVSVELCSVWLQPGEASPQDVLSAMTFGDGAAAAVVGADGAVLRPMILACESVLWPGSLNARAAVLTSTGFRHVTSAALPVSVLRHLRASVAAFLERQGLSMADLGFLVVNPRNERLLAVLAHLLRVPESFLIPSRSVWATRGNTLSVGPLYLLQVLQGTAPPREGDLGVVVVLGHGVSCELMLLRWHGAVPCADVGA